MISGYFSFSNIRFREKRVNSRPRRKARQRSPSHFGSKSHPSREKRSFVSVANIGATQFGCDFFRSQALASAGSLFKGLRSAMPPHFSIQRKHDGAAPENDIGITVKPKWHQSAARLSHLQDHQPTLNLPAFSVPHS